MFYEAYQLVHANQRTKTKSLNNKDMSKIGNSTTTIRKVNSQPVMFGSSVAIHKLRESKWFSHSESKILCSVVESGFILEKRFKSDNLENEWGIACWEPGFEKSKNKDYIHIYTVVTEKDKMKVRMLQLKEFWTEDSNVRINNNDDKTNPPNSDMDIHKQIQHALKNKNMKWHNSQHFTHWCRYTIPNFKRSENGQVSDRVKWNSVSVTAGLLMIKNKLTRATS